MSQPLLKLDQATIRFGGLTAVGDFSLNVHANELVGLIGPNGAGKTTAFNLITGVYQPTAGTIHFGGRSIRERSPMISPSSASLAPSRTSGCSVH
jgi:branched-chain amino acid transport system ATP-binding protein